MPQLPSIEVHAPQLHLPGLVKHLHLPDLPAAVGTFEWPRIDLSSVDVGETVAEIATAAHLRSHPRRPRWPLAVTALIVAGLAGWIAFRQKTVRDAVTRTAGTVRAWVSTARSSHRATPHDIDRVEPVAFTAAETAMITNGSSPDGSTPGGSGYPAGLGSNIAGDTAPIEEESRTEESDDRERRDYRARGDSGPVHVADADAEPGASAT